MLRPLPRTGHAEEEKKRKELEEAEAKKRRQEDDEKARKEEEEKNRVIRTRDYLVGDGGASWRAKAKLR